MKWLWTWRGACFGYLDNQNLWTHDGKHVGRLVRDEIYGSNGQYLGEVMSDNRLITNKNKKGWRKPAFMPYARRVGCVKFVGYIGYIMYVGHEDFPKPESF